MACWLRRSRIFSPTSFPHIRGRGEGMFFLCLFQVMIILDHFGGPLWHLNSRRSRQRVHRRRTLFSREQETVSALNHLAGFCDRGDWPSAPLNRAQEAVLLHVRRAHHSRPQPCEKVSPQAALRQLLKRGTGYSGESPGTLASYVRERISLPRSGSGRSFGVNFAPN